jgi:hypothetical protein
VEGFRSKWRDGACVANDGTLGSALENSTVHREDLLDVLGARQSSHDEVYVSYSVWNRGAGVNSLNSKNRFKRNKRGYLRLQWQLRESSRSNRTR